LAPDDYTVMLDPPFCPKPEDIFRAFRYFEPQDTKVVIIGQDPYHSVDKEGNIKANGLAFGINPDWVGRRIQSSFGNMLNELPRHIVNNDMVEFREWASLESWAAQGVLLINTKLTVKPGEPLSHTGLGWEQYVVSVLTTLARRHKDIVWTCWGYEALKIFNRIMEKHHTSHSSCIATSHPGHFSASRKTKDLIAFKNSKVFELVNEQLAHLGHRQIDWTKGLPKPV
jgi:uracil-DNA glycosylase